MLLPLSGTLSPLAAAHRVAAGGAIADPTALPNLELWLSDTGASAATWPDLSGNGRDSIQATLVRQPAIVPGVLHGRQVRRFDGADDKMSLWWRTLPFTAFFVLKGAVFGLIDSAPWTANLFRSRAAGGSGSNEDGFDFWDGSPYFALSGNASTFRVLAVGGNFTTSRVVRCFENGVPVSAAGIPSSTNIVVTTPSLGDCNEGISGVFSGDIAEIVLYSADLSTADWQAVEDYLGAKYGITITH